MSNLKKTALYCRLSQDDGIEGDSNSIQNQNLELQYKCNMKKEVDSQGILH